ASLAAPGARWTTGSPNWLFSASGNDSAAGGPTVRSKAWGEPLSAPRRHNLSREALALGRSSRDGRHAPIIHRRRHPVTWPGKLAILKIQTLLSSGSQFGPPTGARSAGRAD